MARSNSQINVAIALDTAPLEAGQRRAIKQFDKIGSVGQRASGSLKTLGKGIATVGALSGVMAGTVGVASAKMIELASDSEESANAFGVTFREASDELNSFVDEFSTKAGFTTAELQELLSFTGGVVKGMGASSEASAEFSKEVAKLSGDIGSLRNRDPEQVLRAITSALTGEREQLKGLGVVLKQVDVDQRALTMTNKNAVSELTSMEKAQATLTLIQEASSDAIGDLDRTSDGFANTQRRLKAELRETATQMGEALMPTVNELLPVISDLAEKVLPVLVEKFQNGVKAVKEFSDQFGDQIMERLKRSFQMFKDISTIFAEVISRIFEFISNNKILKKLFGELDNAGQGFADRLHEIAEGIRAENEAEKKANRRREERQAQYKNSTEATEDLTDATDDLTDSIEDNTDSVDDQSEELQYGAVEFDKYTKSIKSALSSIKTLTGLQERGKQEQEDLDRATAELEESNIQVAKAQQELANAQAEVTRLQADGTEITAEEELAILKLKESIQELTDAQDGSREKELELILAKEQLIELEAEATAQSDAYHEAVKSVTDAEEDLAKAVEDQKKAREEQIQAKKDLAKATEVTAEALLTEALAVKELEKAFGSFEGETFKQTLEEIAKLTGKKISEIEEAFKNAGLTETSFNVPDSSNNVGSDTVEAPTFEETAQETNNQGGNQGGSVQPVKIYTTLNIGSEKFETVTQDALISLQKQGKKVLL